MPIQILSSSGYGFAASNSRLLVENIQLSIRSSSATASNQVTQTTDPSLARIESLVSQIKERILDASSSGASSDLQRFIDDSLGEISYLVGSPLKSGGGDQAIVQGVNAHQIEGVEVLSLPDGAATSFAGGRINQAKPGRVLVENSDRLLSGGGRLLFGLGSSQRSFQVRSGDSVDAIASKINERNLGVRASVSRGSLLITSRTAGSSVNVVSQTNRALFQHFTNEIKGQNDSQVANLDLSGTSGGQNITITGSRDSIATSATLTYLGDTHGQATGDASFTVTGSAGSADLFVSEGESLENLAARVASSSGITGVTADVEGNTVVFRSTSVGDSASVSISNIVQENEVSVTGVNTSQIDPFQVVSIPDDTEITLTGQVTQAAQSAQQVYHGTIDGLIADTATFTLGGSLGSQNISIVEGESIEDVRDRVNQVSSSTGIVANTIGNDLVFESEVVGSSESVSITLQSIAQEIDVTGLNASQVSNFQVLSAEPASSNTLNANVSQTATHAQLTYDGTLGFSQGAATITLAGHLGSESISVSGLQGLSSVRNAINDKTSQTGVSATLSGNRITLKSTLEGSDGFIDVDVQSGNFNVNGGDGNGYAEGEDIQLNINGNDITGTGNDVTYTDALGSYSFSVNAGFVGNIDPITVTSTNGTFDVTGGDINGTSVGVDAEAIVNGETLVAAGKDFDLAIEGAEFAFSTKADFVGTIDPITIRSERDDFQLFGGDGNGNASGQNGWATINGQSVSSSTDSFDYDSGNGMIGVQFADSFVGNFDDIEVSSGSKKRLRSSGSETYSARGSQQTFDYDGQRIQADRGRYVLEQDGIEITIRLAPGFSGEFDSFTVAAGGEITGTSSESPLSGQLQEATKTALAELLELASGGKHAGANFSLANSLSILVDAASSLGQFTGGSSPQGKSLSGYLLDQSV
ncbi:Flagellin hook IN motif protein [Rubripirellula amarantea]|uniref:Flagellin hook IN motif protein n=1 Tax=Rubripirellula amarantea TaxID=2527999 RepID=A0A5C5WWG5_9BACT|nr:flagellin hook IN motif-containing protein [Rubripirellula amarantea]TWT54323.1 Flagellin hook IN motif protein [Rubripirellula amarantea]